MHQILCLVLVQVALGVAVGCTDSSPGTGTLYFERTPSFNATWQYSIVVHPTEARPPDLKEAIDTYLKGVFGDDVAITSYAATNVYFRFQVVERFAFSVLGYLVDRLRFRVYADTLCTESKRTFSYCKAGDAKQWKFFIIDDCDAGSAVEMLLRHHIVPPDYTEGDFVDWKTCRESDPTQSDLEVSAMYGPTVIGALLGMGFQITNCESSSYICYEQIV
jgi:hypothetical protein